MFDTISLEALALISGGHGTRCGCGSCGVRNDSGSVTGQPPADQAFGSVTGQRPDEASGSAERIVPFVQINRPPR